MAVIACLLFASLYLIHYVVTGDYASLIVLNIYCAASFVLSAINKKNKSNPSQ